MLVYEGNTPKVGDDLAIGLPLGVEEEGEALPALRGVKGSQPRQRFAAGKQHRRQAVALPGPHAVRFVDPVRTQRPLPRPPQQSASLVAEPQTLPAVQQRAAKGLPVRQEVTTRSRHPM